MEKKVTAAKVAASALVEFERLNGMAKLEADLVAVIKKNLMFFLCIQTQSKLSWGLIHKMMNGIQHLGLEVINHHLWHPRGINKLLVNKIYCTDSYVLMNSNKMGVMETKMEEIKTKLMEAINQPVQLL